MGTWKKFMYKMASQQQSASEDTSEVVLIATKKYQSITENKQPRSVCYYSELFLLTRRHPCNYSTAASARKAHIILP